MAERIDGKALSKRLLDEVAAEVAELKKNGIHPGLAVVLVGEDPASLVYVRNKRRTCKRRGIASFAHDLPVDAAEADVLALIDKLNADPAVHGILVQLPMPKHISEEAVVNRIDPRKDVDGLHPANVGLLTLGTPRFVPCTPAGIMYMLDAHGVELQGKRAVVVGRSTLVGKPIASLLLARHATVTICHSRTAALATRVSEADVVVAAVGRPELVRGDWIQPGAVVIDVGINRLDDGRLVGDVAFEEAQLRASLITPVPGGVGPMTIASLMANTVAAAKQ